MFRFTRLISPVSAIEVSFEYENLAFYNDWHPVKLVVTMVEGASADGLELTMWLTSSGGERLFEMQIKDQKTMEYEMYDPQSKGVCFFFFFLFSFFF